MSPSHLLPPLLHRLLTMSLEASVLTLLIAAVLLILRHRIPPRWRYILWSLVLVKLILPTSLPTPLSLYNLLPPGSRATAPSTSSPILAVSQFPAPPAPTGDAPYTSPVAAIPLPEPLTPPTTSLSAPFPYLTVLYLTGALTLTLLVVTQSLRLSLAIRAQRPLTDQTTLDLLEDAKQQMRVRTHLPLIETDRVATPSLFGFIRPKLLLPARSYERLLRDQLRHVLLHELAHLKRLDVPINCLATLLLILHWFNPLIWLVLARMRAERELACDAMVLDLLHRDPDAPHAYGQTLLELLAEPARTRPLANLACVLENPHQLKHRIAMIASFRPTPWLTTITAASLLLLLTAVGLTQAKPHQDHPPKSKPAATESPSTPPLSPGMAMPGSPDSSNTPSTQPTSTTPDRIGGPDSPVDMPPYVAAWIVGEHLKFLLTAQSLGLDVNTHIIGVDDQFIRTSGGLLTYVNHADQPVEGLIPLGNFGSERPDFILVDETGQPQTYEVRENPSAFIGRYGVWWSCSRPIPPGATRILGYISRNTVPLRPTDDQTHALTLENFYGNPVLENFFLVLPDNLQIAKASVEPTSVNKVEGLNVYLWQLAVPANTSHRVDLQLQRRPTNKEPSTTQPAASSPRPDPQQRRQPFLDRINLDRQRYSPDQRREIERLYQVANKNWRSPQAIQSLETLIARYPDANRTGCALLYLGQMSEGPTRERYLLRAMNDFPDCYYGDGVQVGPYAMLHLANYYLDLNRPDDARSLLDKIRQNHPTAIDHRGRLLIDHLPSIPPADEPTP